MIKYMHYRCMIIVAMKMKIMKRLQSTKWKAVAPQQCQGALCEPRKCCKDYICEYCVDR